MTQTKIIPIDYNDLPFMVTLTLSKDNSGSYDTPPAPTEKVVDDIVLLGYSVTEVLDDEVKQIIIAEAEQFASWD